MLLDTHIFITAAVQGIEGLTSKTAKLLRNKNTERVLSAISGTEIAIKFTIGKLRMNSGQIGRGMTDLGITLLPYTHHGDPLDRMLIAAAMVENLPILTSDALFRTYNGLHVIHA